MTAILLWIFIAAVTVCLWSFFRRRSRKLWNLPPGPPSLPIVGNFHQLDYGDVAGTYCKYAAKYGPIFTFKLGGQRLILLNDVALVKEVYAKEEFNLRPRIYAIKLRRMVNDGATGVMFAEGDHWREHRRFVLTNFRDSGVGKSRMEEKIIEEALYLRDVLASHGAEPIDCKLPISTAIANVIANILTSHRYETDDPEFVRFLELNRQNFAYSWKRGVMAFLPWTRHFVPQIKAKYHDTIDMYKGLRNFFASTIGEHMEKWMPEESQDFLSSYITAVKSGTYPRFSVAEIPLLMEDLFEAGYDTTTTTLRWAFLLVALHEHVQDRIHEELDSKLPTGTLSLSDKLDLPYTEATLMETHRFASIVPQGLPHTTLEDARIDSYDIPKGSWIMANIRYVHHDPAYWDEPEKFNPQRFLSSSNQILPSEHLIPFSVGKRRCLGEALAKTEALIFFVTILQHFTIKATPCFGDKEIDMVPVSGLIADAKPHLLQFIPRTFSTRKTM